MDSPVWNAPAAAVLTVAEMYRADALAMAGGTPGAVLMENAGAAIARAIRQRWTPRRVVVLCGPGNNGGDGFVVARWLDAAGWPVTLALLGARDALKGDAAAAAARWRGAVAPLAPACLNGAELVVDAVFGAGLARPLEGVVLATITAVAALAQNGVPVVAVDVPSGVHGDSGQVQGGAAPAALTVTFFRPKPGHFLFPGRALCGELVVADIGIPESVLAPIAPTLFLNGPDLWRGALPCPTAASHKYSRGHALILGGGTMTGAARLAAQAALRVGAGLVTVAAPPAAVPIYALSLAALLVAPLGEHGGWEALLADARRNALLVGPGAGRGTATRQHVAAALSTRRACVLDADALTSFADTPETLFHALHPGCLLTPHGGEFTRLFGCLPPSERLTAARAAAAHSGATVLLKGADTVIAAPDGRAIINSNAPPWLATAGSGDVLAGLCVGLLAQGLPPPLAAATAAWLHGAVATHLGPGLVADDLPAALPAVLRNLLGRDAPKPQGPSRATYDL